jgi:hypothetical protein
MFVELGAALTRALRGELEHLVVLGPIQHESVFLLPPRSSAHVDGAGMAGQRRLTQWPLVGQIRTSSRACFGSPAPALTRDGGAGGSRGPVGP